MPAAVDENGQLIARINPANGPTPNAITFTLTVTGGVAPYHTLWYKSGVLISAATDQNTWTVANATNADEGDYKVVVTDSH